MTAVSYIARVCTNVLAQLRAMFGPELDVTIIVTHVVPCGEDCPPAIYSTIADFEGVVRMTRAVERRVTNEGPQTTEITVDAVHPADIAMSKDPPS